MLGNSWPSTPMTIGSQVGPSSRSRAAQHPSDWSNDGFRRSLVGSVWAVTCRLAPNGDVGSWNAAPVESSGTRKELVEENQIHLDGLALRAEGTHRNTQESIVLEE